MNCELWVRGSAWTGYETIDVNVLFRSGFSGSIPQVSIETAGGNGSIQYFDGFGGNFSGTGWYGAPVYYLKNCTNPANERCDCVNGGCVPKTTYNTPGVFLNLAACESGCAKNSNCTGECIDPAEIAALRQSLNTLQSKFCRS